MKTWKCKTATFSGLRLYKVGEVVTAEKAPNCHFVEVGVKPQPVPERKPEPKK